MAARKTSASKKEPDWSSLPLYLNMRKRAVRDPLTDLYHRDRLMHELDLVMLMARSHRHAFALALIDLDGMRKINIAHTKTTGDQVLGEISDLFKKSARVMDFICRTGGNEFAILLPKSSVDGSRIFADRVLKRVRENVFCKSTHKLRLTASMGIAVLKPGHTTLSPLTLVERAREMLKKAKQLGGDQYCLASEPEED